MRSSRSQEAQNGPTRRLPRGLREDNNYTRAMANTALAFGSAGPQPVYALRNGNTHAHTCTPTFTYTCTSCTYLRSLAHTRTRNMHFPIVRASQRCFRIIFNYELCTGYTVPPHAIQMPTHATLSYSHPTSCRSRRARRARLHPRLRHFILPFIHLHELPILSQVVSRCTEPHGR